MDNCIALSYIAVSSWPLRYECIGPKTLRCNTEASSILEHVMAACRSLPPRHDNGMALLPAFGTRLHTSAGESQTQHIDGKFFQLVFRKVVVLRHKRSETFSALSQPFVTLHGSIRILEILDHGFDGVML
jgi:hypothetical protein